MPINRVPYPNALPTEQNDYVKQNDLLEAGFWRVNEPIPIDGAGNIVQGAVFQVGGTIYYCTAATAIGGVASPYVKLTPTGGGAQLQPDYVANLGGVSWNAAYNGYYDALGNLYMFNEAQAMIAGEIAAVVGRYVQQTRDGDMPAGRDVVAGRNLDFSTGIDADHEIKTASDASLLWDESEDNFIFNKAIKSSYGRKITFTWQTAVAKTENDWFDQLSPYVPNVGDEIIISGSLLAPTTGRLRVLNSVKRKDANTITLYGLENSGASFSNDCVNGDGTNVSTDLSISI